MKKFMDIRRDLEDKIGSLRRPVTSTIKVWVVSDCTGDNAVE